MASTSRLRESKATTVGSLRTRPFPFAYTRVLGVPRSMARSRDMRPHGTARPARDRTTRADLGSLDQVSDTPEEPVDGEPGPEEGGGGEDPESPLRGWIDP